VVSDGEFGGYGLCLCELMVVWLVSEEGRGEKELTGAEEVLIIKRSPPDECFVTSTLISCDCVCDVYAGGICRGFDQQVAEDTDVDQLLLQLFCFGLTEALDLLGD